MSKRIRLRMMIMVTAIFVVMTVTMTVMMVPNDRYSQEVASFQGGALGSVNGKLVNSKPFLHCFGLQRIHCRFKSGYFI